MRPRRARARGLLALLLTWLLGASNAVHAQEGASEAAETTAAVPSTLSKEQCVDANGQAQEHRRDGKLALARERLRTCANPACPSIVRDDCTQRLDELERAQPTIAFSVQDASGTDLSHVVVRMDGATLTTLLDGSAMPVDIGQHTFEFSVEGHTPVVRTLIAVEGEKLRRERIALSAPIVAPRERDGAQIDPANAEDRPPPTGLGVQKLSGVVAGGVGAVLLVGGAAFGLVASSRWSAAEKQCPTHRDCSTKAMHDRDAAADYATVSTVGLIAGGLLVAAGVTLFFTAPKAARANLKVRLSSTALQVRGSF